MGINSIAKSLTLDDLDHLVLYNRISLTPHRKPLIHTPGVSVSHAPEPAVFYCTHLPLCSCNMLNSHCCQFSPAGAERLSCPAVSVPRFSVHYSLTAQLNVDQRGLFLFPLPPRKSSCHMRLIPVSSAALLLLIYVANY